MPNLMLLAETVLEIFADFIMTDRDTGHRMDVWMDGLTTYN